MDLLRILLSVMVTMMPVLETRAGFSNVTSTRGEPWPRPQRIEYRQEHFRVDVNEVPIQLTGHSCVDLERAAARYQKLIRELILMYREAGESWRSPMATKRPLDASRSTIASVRGPPALERIEVQLRSGCGDTQYPEFGMDESYELKVNTADAHSRALVIADSLWGAYRGLETLSQLFYFDDAVFVRSCHVVDYPRYGHRGFLLDTGRHFLTVDVIKQNIDLMAHNKYNVFHWHVVDDPSFPFESETLANIGRLGAFRRDKMYKSHHVADIIEYARRRGIRVIPEFDTPGHTRSWGAGVPGLLTDCYANGKRDGTFGPIDPTDDAVYAVLAELFNEITQRFPDRYIHVGGDEVNFGYACWLSNPTVQRWMAVNNITTPEGIEDAYIRRLLSLVASLPAKPEYVVWQDVIDHNVSVRPNTIVQVWKEPWKREMNKVTARGHRAILSSCWYLNRIKYGVDWAPYYLCEPESFGGTAAQNRLVIGGEAAMWGEYVDNTNVVSRSWPRASAPAERLWSAKNVTSLKEAASRLEEHRCRMVYRGFGVGPINGPGFC